MSRRDKLRPFSSLTSVASGPTVTRVVGRQGVVGRENGGSEGKRRGEGGKIAEFHRRAPCGKRKNGDGLLNVAVATAFSLTERRRGVKYFLEILGRREKKKREGR